MATFDLDHFVAAYVEAIFFTETGEDDQPSPDIELSADAMARARAECETFLWRVYPYLDHIATAREMPRADVYTEAAHDFWFTRNGHGVGFWETDDWPICGDVLDKAAQSFGGVDAYETDAGELDVM